MPPRRSQGLHPGAPGCRNQATVVPLADMRRSREGCRQWPQLGPLARSPLRGYFHSHWHSLPALLRSQCAKMKRAGMAIRAPAKCDDAGRHPPRVVPAHHAEVTLETGLGRTAKSFAQACPANANRSSLFCSGGGGDWPVRRYTRRENKAAHVTGPYLERPLERQEAREVKIRETRPGIETSAVGPAARGGPVSGRVICARPPKGPVSRRHPGAPSLARAPGNAPTNAAAALSARKMPRPRGFKDEPDSGALVWLRAAAPRPGRLLSCDETPNREPHIACCTQGHTRCPIGMPSPRSRALFGRGANRPGGLRKRISRAEEAKRKPGCSSAAAKWRAAVIRFSPPGRPPNGEPARTRWPHHLGPDDSAAIKTSRTGWARRGTSFGGGEEETRLLRQASV
ncbi:hypothetical protein MTO96_049688 [Rhipicephalus appendiculatus]